MADGLTETISSGLATTADASTLASSLGAAVGTACNSAGIAVDPTALATAVAAAATSAGIPDSGAIAAQAAGGVASTASTMTYAQYSVTPSGDGNEVITPSSALTVAGGTTQSFTVTANSGFNGNTTVGGTCPAGTWDGGTYKTGAITRDCSVIFAAAQNLFTVTASGDGGGTAAPGTQSVAAGASTTVTVTANPAMSANSAVGGTCPAGSWSGVIYTTGAITANCSVTFTTDTNIYVPNSSVNAVAVYSNGGTLLRTISDAAIVAAEGVAVDAAGNVYVANTGTNGSYNKVFVYGPTGNTSLRTITVQSQPFAVSLDASDNIYVAGSNHMNEYDSTGALVRTIPSGVSGPWGAVPDANGNVFAAMNIQTTNAVYEYGPSGTAYIARFSTPGLNYPYCIAIDASGNFYTANVGNNTVTKISSTGTRLLAITPPGASSLSGVAVDAKGNIYIGDGGNETITEYAPDGVTIKHVISGIQNDNGPGMGIAVR